MDLPSASAAGATAKDTVVGHHRRRGNPQNTAENLRIHSLHSPSSRDGPRGTEHRSSSHLAVKGRLASPWRDSGRCLGELGAVIGRAAIRGYNIGRPGSAGYGPEGT